MHQLRVNNNFFPLSLQSRSEIIRSFYLGFSHLCHQKIYRSAEIEKHLILLATPQFQNLFLFYFLFKALLFVLVYFSVCVKHIAQIIN